MKLELKDIAIVLAIAGLIWRGGAWFERVEAHLRYNDMRIDRLDKL